VLLHAIHPLMIAGGFHLRGTLKPIANNSIHNLFNDPRAVSSLNRVQETLLFPYLDPSSPYPGLWHNPHHLLALPRQFINRALTPIQGKYLTLSFQIWSTYFRHRFWLAVFSFTYSHRLRSFYTGIDCLSTFFELLSTLFCTIFPSWIYHELSLLWIESRWNYRTKPESRLTSA